MDVAINLGSSFTLEETTCYFEIWHREGTKDPNNLPRHVRLKVLWGPKAIFTWWLISCQRSWSDLKFRKYVRHNTFRQWILLIWRIIWLCPFRRNRHTECDPVVHFCGTSKSESPTRIVTQRLKFIYLGICGVIARHVFDLPSSRPVCCVCPVSRRTDWCLSWLTDGWRFDFMCIDIANPN